MFRKTIAAALLGLTCTLTAAADDDKKPGDDKAGKLDRSKLFARMDADGDGKVSRAEFKKAMEAVGEKLKDAGKGEKLAGMLDRIADKGFEKLDANGDGVVSKEEFEKAGGMLGDLKGKIDPAKLKNLKNLKQKGE